MTDAAWPTRYWWPTATNWPGSAIPPSGLSGTVLWVDGRAQAYSDTGATVQANPFTGRVRRVGQSAPASGDVTAASDAVRPFRETSALSFQVGGAESMACPISPAVTQNALTVALSFTMRDNFPGGPQWLLSHSAGTSVLTFSNNVLNLKYNGGTNWFVAPAAFPTNYALIPTGASVSVVFRLTPAQISAAVSIDGVRTDYSTAVTVNSTSLPGAGWLLGWDGATAGAQLHGAIGQVALVNRAISDSETNGLMAWLDSLALNVRRCPSQVPCVVLAGDSIARGFLLESNRSAIWSFTAQQALDATQPVNLINAALSGAGIANMVTAYPTTMAPFYDGARSRNVLVGAIGTNDMATLNKDGPTTLADYFAFLDSAKASGWRIVACSVLPRTGTGHDATFETARLYFNSAVAAQWAGKGYHAFADVAAITLMQNPADTLYYLDAIHPTFLGNTQLEPVYRAAIQAAIT